MRDGISIRSVLCCVFPFVCTRWEKRKFTDLRRGSLSAMIKKSWIIALAPSTVRRKRISDKTGHGIDKALISERYKLMKQESFFFNGYEATVLIPDNFNGKWIWKTEFFYAFDRAERDLFDLGFARVYYKISDMYGSVKAVRLMHAFQKELIKRYSFAQKAIMFGFSRGGLYAFNYALYYPEQVEKVYLDAPVLDIKTWPQESS